MIKMKGRPLSANESRRGARCAEDLEKIEEIANQALDEMMKGGK